MKPDFDYRSVPNNFVHCLNKECPEAAYCLRRQVTLRLPSDQGVIAVLSPLFEHPRGESCPYFKSDELKRFALGMTHLLDNIPHRQAVGIRKQMIARFERNTFYRCWSKKRLIRPDEQQIIRQIFLDNGITSEPVYDEYIEQYDW